MQLIENSYRKDIWLIDILSRNNAEVENNHGDKIMPQITERIFFSFICRLLIVLLDFLSYVDKIKPNHEDKNCGDKASWNEKRGKDRIIVADSNTSLVVVVDRVVNADIIVAAVERSY